MSQQGDELWLAAFATAQCQLALGPARQGDEEHPKVGSSIGWAPRGLGAAHPPSLPPHPSLPPFLPLRRAPGHQLL